MGNDFTAVLQHVLGNIFVVFMNLADHSAKPETATKETFRVDEMRYAKRLGLWLEKAMEELV